MRQSTMPVSRSLVSRFVLIRTVLSRMIRTIVLNETNFKSLIHHIHKLKDHGHVSLDDCQSRY